MDIVNYIDECDWIEYDIEIATAGVHVLQFNVATPHANSSLQIKCREEILCTIENPNTGGWKNWHTMASSISLTIGHHTLQIYALGNGFNIIDITFSPLSAVQSSNVLSD